MATTKPLTRREVELWHAWKRSSEAILARVAHDVLDATGLSGADYAVLSTLIERGNGRLRQRELARGLNWDKSRISHQLARMQERELLDRSKTVEHGSRIEILRAGRDAFAQARPVYAQAVRRHLLDRLTAEQTEAILTLVDSLEHG